MRRSTLLLILALLATTATARESDTTTRAWVTAPYVEMRTGPGRGYPVFHVVEQGESLRLLHARTDWIRVETEKGKRGWIRRTALSRLADGDGRPLALAETGRSGFESRHWEIGVLGGDMAGARLLTLYAGVRLAPILSAEISLSEALGNFSTSRMANLDLVAEPFPQWRLSPFFLVGGGVVEIHPRATLVQERDRVDSSAHAGLGIRVYLGRRFLLRAEYRDHKIFTSRNENEETSEWKAGFAFFY